MARSDVTGRKQSAVTDDADAFTIVEFCRRHRISSALFYKFRNQMPATFRIGTRVLISRESAARWRAERVRAAETEDQPANA